MNEELNKIITAISTSLHMLGYAEVKVNNKTISLIRWDTTTPRGKSPDWIKEMNKLAKATKESKIIE